jgi:putative flippase GtrA
MKPATPVTAAGAAQPAKFLLVGTAGFAVNLAAFAALYHAGAPYVAASVASYLMANLVMYLGNRYYTFRLGHDGLGAAYLRYLGVGLLVAALTAGLLALLVGALGLAPTVGQAVALLLLTPVGFVLFKRWSFRA